MLAKVLGAKLIRLQCYEGLDANTALYEWNYPKQMLRIKLEEVEHGDRESVETEIFTQDYLIKRPLLEAIQSDGAGPLSINRRIDRADMVEAFLLEVFQIFRSPFPGSARSVPSTGPMFSHLEPYA